MCIDTAQFWVGEHAYSIDKNRQPKTGDLIRQSKVQVRFRVIPVCGTGGGGGGGGAV